MTPTSIYQDYKHALSRVCAKLVPDPRDAQELVHDSFLKIFQKLDTYDPRKGSLYTWMRKIVINTALDQVRTKTVRWVELPEEMENSVTVLPHFRPDNLLSALPPASRQVLKLYFIDGYSHRDIGGMLGITEGTSRWHLSSARKILRQKLNQLQ